MTILWLSDKARVCTLLFTDISTFPQTKHSNWVTFNMGDNHYMIWISEFFVASKINHAPDRANVRMDPQDISEDELCLGFAKPYLVVVASRDIDAGEELFLDYGKGFFEKSSL
jgi:hypothetical protein